MTYQALDKVLKIFDIYIGRDMSKPFFTLHYFKSHIFIHCPLFFNGYSLVSFDYFITVIVKWWNIGFCDTELSLPHWGRVTHICVGNLSIIGSDNGLSPGRRQAITWTNVGILLIGPLGTNFSEMLIKIHTFSFKKMHLKMSSGKWRPFCLGLNVLSVTLDYIQRACVDAHYNVI